MSLSHPRLSGYMVHLVECSFYKVADCRIWIFLRDTSHKPERLAFGGVSLQRPCRLRPACFVAKRYSWEIWDYMPVRVTFFKRSHRQSDHIWIAPVAWDCAAESVRMDCGAATLCFNRFQTSDWPAVSWPVDLQIVKIISGGILSWIILEFYHEHSSWKFSLPSQVIALSTVVLSAISSPGLSKSRWSKSMSWTWLFIDKSNYVYFAWNKSP